MVSRLSRKKLGGKNRGKKKTAEQFCGWGKASATGKYREQGARSRVCVLKTRGGGSHARAREKFRGGASSEAAAGDGSGGESGKNKTFSAFLVGPLR